VKAFWHLGLDGDDPPTWGELSELHQVELCCQVIDAEVGWLHDALSMMSEPVCLAALKRMDDTPLGLELRRAVLDTCRDEVEKRLQDGDWP
jgi:hypothetical protein